MTNDEIDAAYDAAFAKAWQRLGGPVDTLEAQHEAVRAVVEVARAKIREEAAMVCVRLSNASPDGMPPDQENARGASLLRAAGQIRAMR